MVIWYGGGGSPPLSTTCFRYVHDMPCLRHVHDVFMTYSWHFHDMFMKCSRHIHNMFTTCSWYHNMFMACSPHVHHMLTACLLHVHQMFTPCSHIFTTCSPHVHTYSPHVHHMLTAWPNFMTDNLIRSYGRRLSLFILYVSKFVLISSITFEIYVIIFRCAHRRSYCF